MLDRLRRRGLQLGAQVSVLAGPYAGSAGRITEVAPDGTFRVTVDDCCRPYVAAADLRVVKAPSIGDRIDQAEGPLDIDNVGW